MSPSSGPEEQQRWCAHGWVVMARFLCRGPTAHPLLPQKPEERWAVGKFATSPSHDQPFPRAVEWRRGDGGGRAGGGRHASDSPLPLGFSEQTASLFRSCSSGAVARARPLGSWGAWKPTCVRGRRLPDR